MKLKNLFGNQDKSTNETSLEKEGLFIPSNKEGMPKPYDSLKNPYTLLDYIESEWDFLLNDKEFNSDFKIIIQDFFKKDCISLKNYMDNQIANEIYTTQFLETKDEDLYEEDLEKIKLCSHAFRDDFLDFNFKKQTPFPEWIYKAYPEVLVWFLKKKSNFEEEILNNVAIYSTNGNLNNNFYRFMIDKYLEFYPRLRISHFYPVSKKQYEDYLNEKLLNKEIKLDYDDSPF
jgi:hypothetical protein